MKIFFYWLTIIACLATVSSCVNRELAQQPLVRIENAHKYASDKLAFSPTGKYLASGGHAGDIKIWSVPDLTLMHTFTGHEDAPRGIVWVDDETLVSADDDGRIFLWNFLKNKILLTKNTPSSIAALTFSAKQNLIISGHDDGVLRAYDSLTFGQVAEYDTGDDVLSVVFNPLEDMVAVSNVNRRVALLNGKLEFLKDLSHPPLNAVEIAFSPDARQLAGGNWFKLFFWEIPSGKLTVVKSDHWGIAYSIDYSPDGRYLATIGRNTDSEIYLVDPRTGKQRRHLLGHDLCGSAVRISPDGRFLASAGDDSSIRLYDLTTPDEPR